MLKLISRILHSKELCHSQLFDNQTFYKVFTKDLLCASRRVCIESPYITKRRIAELLPVLERLREKDVAITINTRCPDEHNGMYIQQAYDAVQSMQELGIKVLYTVKHHRKLAVIDDVLWEGSLNILSQNDSCEIMRRIESKSLVNQMIAFAKLDKF
ncbi:hypothetical protein BH09PAT4_BH09PAT4_00210 [soil metagenome]